MEQYELIDNYLSNNLSNEEKLAFEQQVATNPQLAEELAIYKAINDTMQQNVAGNENLFKETIAPLQQQYFNNTDAKVVTMPTNKAKVRKMIFGAIAAAAILIIVFTLVPIGGSKQSSDELYAQYATHEIIENTVRGTNEKNYLQLGTDLYNTKKYAEAIPYLEKVKDSSAQAMLLLGISYTQTNNIINAHISYDNIIKGESVFKEKAIWYKALAYLKNKELANCKTQLNKLLNSETYKKNATTILKNL
jgi:tetratricopeptide (TPR) repeat protein